MPRAEGEIPHYLPNRNPFLLEHAIKNRLPAETVLGGAETMYPEYQQKLKTLPNATAPPPGAGAAAGRGGR